ncbi:hypothetical protein Y695_02792 [Hydrogenophaga sp. T4]|nr:hypothetical protein Y695_02792 [Hydrogenophaga sp. T4]
MTPAATGMGPTSKARTLMSMLTPKSSSLKVAQSKPDAPRYLSPGPLLPTMMSSPPSPFMMSARPLPK